MFQPDIHRIQVQNIVFVLPIAKELRIILFNLNYIFLVYYKAAADLAISDKEEHKSKDVSAHKVYNVMVNCGEITRKSLFILHALNLWALWTGEVSYS